MTNPDDGGPAKDMTLLDYFAGQALANPFTCCFNNPQSDRIAKRAYELAVAMLAEKRRRAANCEHPVAETRTVSRSGVPSTWCNCCGAWVESVDAACRRASGEGDDEG